MAIVEFELTWALDAMTAMDYTDREHYGEAIYRFKSLRPRRRVTACSRATASHRNLMLSFQEDAIGIRLRDVIGVDNMMWSAQRIDVSAIAEDPD